MRNVDIRTPKNIQIGDRSVVNKHVLLDGRGGKLNIGHDVDIAQDVYIWTLSHNVDDDIHGGKFGSVIVGDYAWIGARSTIMPGVKIGEGAVVGTGAIVTHDIPPLAIVAGNPAKIIGRRLKMPTYKLDFHPWFR